MLLVLICLGFHSLSFSQAQAAYVAKAGDLIKVAGGSNTVYLVDDIGQRIPLSAEAYRIRYNNDFSLVQSLTEEEVAGRTNHFLINETLSHKEGTLIKYWNSPTIYLLEDGFKRGFTSWDSFEDAGYKLSNVQLVGEYEIYPTGLII